MARGAEVAPTPPSQHERRRGSKFERADDAVRVKLNEARRHGRVFRNRVQLPMLVIAGTFVAAGVAGPITYIGVTRVFDLQTTYLTGLYIGYAFVIPAAAILIMALQPSERRAVRLVAVFLSVMTGVSSVLSTYVGIAHLLSVLAVANGAADSCYVTESGQRSPCTLAAFTVVVSVGVTLLCARGSARIAMPLARGARPAEILARLYPELGLMFSAVFPLLLARLLFGAALGLVHASVMWVSFVVFAAEMGGVGALLLWPGLRTRVYATLVPRGEALGTAVGIAALIGGRSPEAVHALAMQRFRAVRFDALTRDDLATNAPDPELMHSRSSAATFGEVDAFVSHSWYDDPAAKWAHLQAWRDAFYARHRREPLLWIDRLCLPQDPEGLDESLACLPVFLAGCHALLVLAGDTYLERLWAVVELYVWIEMGGEERDVLIELLNAADDDDALAAGGGGSEPSSSSLPRLTRKRMSSASRELRTSGAGALVPAEQELPPAVVEALGPHTEPIPAVVCLPDPPVDDAPDDFNLTPTRRRRVHSGGLLTSLGSVSSTGGTSIGGSVGGSEVRSGMNDEDDSPALASFLALVDVFDVSEAQCADPEARVQLLSVVEAAFGSAEKFNARLTSVLRDALEFRRMRLVRKRALRRGRRNTGSTTAAMRETFMDSMQERFSMPRGTSGALTPTKRAAPRTTSGGGAASPPRLSTSHSDTLKLSGASVAAAASPPKLRTSHSEALRLSCASVTEAANDG